jgi:hypothetical protein
MAAQPATIIHRRPSGMVDNIVLDAVLSESHPLINTVTSHPVEQGSPITDHSRPEANVISMRCWISDTPISQEHKQRIDGALSPYGFVLPSPNDAAALLGKDRADVTYSDIVFAQLVELHEHPRIITVVTSLRTLTDVVIESSTFDRDPKNIHGLSFALSLKRIRIVANASARVVAKDTRAHKPQKTAAVTPKPEPTPREKTLLSRIF